MLIYLVEAKRGGEWVPLVTPHSPYMNKEAAQKAADYRAAGHGYIRTTYRVAKYVRKENVEDTV